MLEIIRKLEPEGILWTAALIAIWFVDPAAHSDISLCLFKNLGITVCPGCGLGHSVAYLYRGEVASSFHAHPLGIPAFVLIFIRCIRLWIVSLKSLKPAEA